MSDPFENLDAIADEFELDVEDDDSGPVYFYYRQGHSDHLWQDGDTLCHMAVASPDEPTDETVAIDEFDPHKLAHISEHLCGRCLTLANRLDIDLGPDMVLEETDPAKRPFFVCPECGDGCDHGVRGSYGKGYSMHRDRDEKCGPWNWKLFEQWRRDPTDLGSMATAESEDMEAGQ